MEAGTCTPRKRHVLIVDDDISLAWSFKRALEHLACDATIVPDGGLALKFVMEHPLDAVVCDLEIARLEGDLLFAAVERINPALAEHFIFITGLHDPASSQKFLGAVTLPVLHKPVAVEMLLDAVIKILSLG